MQELSKLKEFFLQFSLSQTHTLSPLLSLSVSACVSLYVCPFVCPSLRPSVSVLRTGTGGFVRHDRYRLSCINRPYVVKRENSAAVPAVKRAH